jgi:hypothetical protein
MIVIANSSVLIGLSSIGQLNLLKHRFPNGVIIPQAVWQEVVITGSGRPGAVEVANADWLTRKVVQNQTLVVMLQATLDKGEAEVIALTQELKADLTLLDEKEARRVARRLSIPTLGTVGILIWAKRQGMITTLRTELDNLRQKGNFKLSKSLYQTVLQQVGEIK